MKLSLQAHATITDAPYVKAVYSLPLTLDPVLMNDSASLAAGNLIYDGLLRFTPTLSIEGAIAETWSTSPDGRTLTFVLRKNARFHDGTPITANDAKVSLNWALSPQSRVSKYYDCIEENGLQAPDERTLTIRLKHPFPPFLSVLAGATAKILPNSSLGKPGFFESPIGSGAFRFVKHSQSPKQVELGRFESYYRGAPQIATLLLKEYTEQEAIAEAQANRVQDLAHWPLAASSPAFTSGQRIQSPTSATWIIGLNARRGPFASHKIRKLFRHDVDAEGFRKRFYPEAFPASGYVPPGLPGFEQAPLSQVRPNVRPPRERIKIVIPRELARAEDMRSFLSSTLKSRGWNADVVLMGWPELMKGYARKEHQAFLVSMNVDYPDAEFLLRNFESENPDNFSGLRNPRLDEMLHRARTLRDRKERERIYRQAIKLVNDEAVTVTLFHPRANYWISSCVTGFTPNILSDVYIDYTQIAMRPDCGQQVGRR